MFPVCAVIFEDRYAVDHQMQVITAKAQTGSKSSNPFPAFPRGLMGKGGLIDG